MIMISLKKTNMLSSKLCLKMPGVPPPSICKHNARMMGFKRFICMEARYGGGGGEGGGGEGGGTPICKHNARMMGFKKKS